MIRLSWKGESDMDVARDAYNEYVRLGYVARTRDGEILESFRYSLGEIRFEPPLTVAERLDQMDAYLDSD